MTTIVDITPRPHRRAFVWVGAAACALAVLVGTVLGPRASKAARQQQTHRLQVERNGYLETLCIVGDRDRLRDAELESEAARVLCSCVDRSENPAKDCNTPLRVWVVLRDAERCATELRDEAPDYCACLDPIAQLVTRAGGMDVARRRAYGYDECRKRAEAPPLPPPPASALPTALGCEETARSAVPSPARKRDGR